MASHGVGEEHRVADPFRHLHPLSRDALGRRLVAKAAVRERDEEQDSHALPVEAQADCLLVELRQRVKGDSRRLAQFHASTLPHAAQGERALVIRLTGEPFDREVAELFDFVESSACFGDVCERFANLGQLGRAGGVAGRDLQQLAGDGIRIHAFGRLRRGLRPTVGVLRNACGIEVQRDVARQLRPPLFHPSGEPKMNLCQLIARQRPDQHIGDLLVD